MPQDRPSVVQVLPNLVSYMQESDDMFLLLQGTTTLKTFLSIAGEECLKVVERETILLVTKKLLDPKTNEQAALCLGNLVI